MSLNTYRWKPDTCGCIIIEWHDTETHAWGTEAIERKCEAHANVSDEDLRNVICGHVDSEQQRIGSIRRALLHPALPFGYQRQHPTSGEMEQAIKDGVDVQISFEGSDHSRIVHARVIGPVPASESHKKHIQEQVDAIHPKGRIVVH